MTRMHLYCVASGGYVSSATALASEIWQTGVRLQVTLDSAPPAIGQIPENEWSIVPANIDRSETNWNISGNWRLEGGVNDFDPGSFLNDQAGPAFAAWLFTASCFSASVQLRSLKLYPIGSPDGKVVPAPPYAQGSPCVLTYKGTLPTGANSGTMFPPQDSVVASLRTPQIGRRGRGRMYLPPCPTSISSTGADIGVVTSAGRTALAGAQKTLLEALHLNDAVKTRPIVIGAPYADYAVISQVRIGNVVDTQQRRRRSLAEVYTTVTVNLV